MPRFNPLRYLGKKVLLTTRSKKQFRAYASPNNSIKMKMQFPKILGIALAAIGLACAAQASQQPIPALPLTYYPVDQRAEFSKSLNGVWKFKLGGVDADYAQPSYNDGAWKRIRVPGNWELQGFENPSYTKPGDKDGYYRTTFTVPGAWKDRRAFIRFEGVGFAFEFFIDGKRVGSFASSFNRSEFDITGFVTPDKPAVIAVRVMRREKGWEFDTNDDWALSGIHRDVVLFSMPETHVKDYTVVTPVTVTATATQASVRIKAWMETFSKKTAQAALNVNVVDAGGNIVGSLSKPVTFTGPGLAMVEDEMPIANPKLWNAETPNLYRLDVQLMVDGKPVHQITQRIGLRTATIENNVYKLNGQSVKFRGITHHDMHPETGRAMTRDQYIEDIIMMKAANINTIRMSHYPPQKMFLDLCDEYGMYVIDEVPFGFGDKHLTDDSYEDNLALRARATVARDKNQTSVLIWTIGNENPYTPMVVRTAGIVKALDPFRSRCLAHPTGKYYFELPPELDILAPHYLVPRSWSQFQRRKASAYLDDILDRPELNGPVLITEYAHAAGTSIEMLKESWEIMQKNDRFIGGCIWHFQDQGVYRTVPVGTYPGIPKETDTAPIIIGKVNAKTWVAPDRVIDTNGQDGADGIVDADRVPQSDYWAVQKIYSPVVIPIETLSVKPGRQALHIPVENRYDFTDLSDVRASWELRIDGQIAQSGELKLQAKPHSDVSVDFTVDIPENPAMHDQFLRFTFTDAKGAEITQRTIRLMPDTMRGNIYKAWTERAPGNGIKTSETGATVTYTAGKSRLQVNKETGDVQFSAADARSFAFRDFALRVGREPQMSEIRAYKAIGSAYWMPYLLTKPVMKLVSVNASANDSVKVRLKLQFTRVSADKSRGNVSDQGFAADVHLTFSKQGWLDVGYTLTPVNARDHLLELGLAFPLPKTATRLTWLGKGPYAVYPIQAEGMERGVYTVEPREDFDSANRMYGGDRTEVDIAAATDTKGNGLGIVCQSATLSLESEASAAYLSHILLSAGHGEKRTISRANIPAKDLKPVSGSLRLLPLVAGKWPEVFQTVLGNPEISSRIVGSMPKE